MDENLGYQVAESLFSSLKDFVVLGLCGRTGSGCSTASAVLGQEFSALNLPAPSQALNGSIQMAEELILYHYAQKNWAPFYQIKVSRLMTGYLLDATPEDFMTYLSKMFPNISSENRQVIQKAIHTFYHAEMEFVVPDYFIQRIKAEHSDSWEDILSGLGGFLTEDDGWALLFPESEADPDSIGPSVLPKKVQAHIHKEPPFQFHSRSGHPMIPYQYRYENQTCTFHVKLRDMQKLLKLYQSHRKHKEPLGSGLLYWFLYQYAYQSLPAHADRLWETIGETQRGLPTIIMQDIGINLRTWGTPLVYNAEQQNYPFQKEGFLTIIRQANLYLKILRDYLLKQKAYMSSVQLAMERSASRDVMRTSYASILSSLHTGTKQVVVVIDSIKNPFESMYLKARYSSYYLTAIYTDEKERCTRLEHSPKGLTLQEIHTIDTIEQLDAFRKFLSLPTPQKSIRRTDDDMSSALSRDSLKIIVNKLSHEEMGGILPFIMQNVEHCVETADIFINNSSDNKQHLLLKKKLIRYVSLIMNPGLVLPTDIERCMQIAQTAKVNSGCLSRQVGAVLTDDKYQIRSIGWNDVSPGHVPCIYRDMMEVAQHWNPRAYSDFENDDDDIFQEHIKKDSRITEACGILQERGKRIPYCFKDVYNARTRSKNQVHPRSLHAEERAFLTLADQGGASISGGHLFTTSSPCELCTKKVCYMGISKVYYVEPYSGISSKHVMSDGPNDKRPTQELFTGALGRAYMQLYTPILPKKDELELWLGFKLDGDLSKIHAVPSKVKGQLSAPSEPANPASPPDTPQHSSSTHQEGGNSPCQSKPDSQKRPWKQAP